LGCIWRRFFSDNVAEWQIEAVKKSAKTLKDEEVEHSEMAPAEKENQILKSNKQVVFNRTLTEKFTKQENI